MQLNDFSPPDIAHNNFAGDNFTTVGTLIIHWLAQIYFVGRSQLLH